MLVKKKKKEKPLGAWPSQKCKEFVAIGMFYCLFSIDWDSIHTMFDIFCDQSCGNVFRGDSGF